ncbi:MAG: hypothetical protein ACRC40_00080, partial [Fusobacteriaceae bacterium]
MEKIENIKDIEVVESNIEQEEKKEDTFYKVLGVMFEITKKRYYFEVVDETEYKKGDRVVVDTVRGKEIGLVYGKPMMLAERVLVLPLKPVLKKASE